jgi:hypothetical protein
MPAKLQVEVKQFNQALGAFSKNMLPSMAQKLKKVVALEVFRRVIWKSPVDTGRFRANWQLTIGHPATGQVQGTSVQTEAAAVVAGSCPPGVDIWLSNNVPYAQRLEEGHSGQAPAGVVAVTLVEVGHLFK